MKAPRCEECGSDLPIGLAEWYNEDLTQIECPECGHWNPVEE